MQQNSALKQCIQKNEKIILLTSLFMANKNFLLAQNDVANNEMMRRNQGNRANGLLGGGGPRGNQQPQGFGSVPQLSGIAQIVGLALGSPEFQRR